MHIADGLDLLLVVKMLAISLMDKMQYSLCCAEFRVSTVRTAAGRVCQKIPEKEINIIWHQF